MLVVKIEVWPFGNEQKAYELDRLNIVNINTDRESNVASYEATRTSTGRTIYIHHYDRSEGYLKLTSLASMFLDVKDRAQELMEKEDEYYYG